jgi:hypothetical protein
VSNTRFEKDSIYGLDLKAGDIVEMLSGSYTGKQVRFLGYWHPGCRIEISSFS